MPCDAPYSAIGFKGKLFTTGNAVRQLYCYTCLAIGGSTSVGPLRKHSPKTGNQGKENSIFGLVFYQSAWRGLLPDLSDVLFCQPAPKYHTKGCSRSSGDSLGARTLVFVAFEPFSSCEFRASIARTPFCAILWRSPILGQKCQAYFLAGHLDCKPKLCDFVRMETSIAIR